MQMALKFCACVLQASAMHNARPLALLALPCRLDRKIQTQFPANVLSGFDDTMGSTYFNLNELQVGWYQQPANKDLVLGGLPCEVMSFCWQHGSKATFALLMHLVWTP